MIRTTTSETGFGPLCRHRVPTLLHNDWRLDNMAVSPADPGVCVAVYDWDMATEVTRLRTSGR